MATVTFTDGSGRGADADAVDGPQNIPRTTARAATRQHHDERDTADRPSGREVGRGISCPEWYVL
ncbi:hypothetical protein OG782_19545 [Streptomyces sp. NBC_00876]|uniref:hypothetical protein n=1 Tax=Streptomyces sp. NBC_00876 TaxID=2975853 RepID=UPI0038647419|nr:hypothetical protein OG782_19545 [Streptomyces sp. NBC_00876]